MGLGRRALHLGDPPMRHGEAAKDVGALFVDQVAQTSERIVAVAGRQAAGTAEAGLAAEGVVAPGVNPIATKVPASAMGLDED